MAADTVVAAGAAGGIAKDRVPMSENPRIQVRRSRVAGKGVFALRDIRKGSTIVEYIGARRREKDVEDEEGDYVCLFGVGRGWVIDPRIDGNEARYINHSCAPNCEALQYGARVYIEALRTIRKGEELFYNYQLNVGPRPTRAERARYVCRCGAAACRGTLIHPVARKRRSAKSRKKSA